MEIDRETKEAFMTLSEFKALPEYSASFPTGQTPGKIWKSHLRDGDWVLREYELYPEDHPLHKTMIKTNVFDICIKVPA